MLLVRKLDSSFNIQEPEKWMKITKLWIQLMKSLLQYFIPCHVDIPKKSMLDLGQPINNVTPLAPQNSLQLRTYVHPHI